jgi:ubiquinol-cytochrome c reductase iron-sulfur subunit
VKRWLIAALVLLIGKLPRRGRDRPHREPDRKAENVTLALLACAALAAGGFIALYFAEPNTQLLGLALGLALVLLAAACIVAAKRVAPEIQGVGSRPDLVHEQERQEALFTLEAGGEGISRKRFFLLVGGGAVGVLGAALLTPALSCGPEANRALTRSPWRAGRRLVTHDDVPLAADGIGVGELVTAFPEGADKEQLASPLAVVRVRPDELDLPPERRDWAPGGLLAYSKICTHAGCAVGEYRYPLYDPTSPGPALVCPCHYSTFDVTAGGDPIFGPAARPLPQLPLAIDADGNLVAAGGFSGRVGPSWWGVRRG